VSPSNRNERNRAIARELLTNPIQSYKQIADKIGVESLNAPRQTIYQYLHTDSFKAIMAEEARKYYDEEYLKSKVTTAIESTKPEMAVHKGYLELGMRNLGLLVDKTINENHNFNETDLDKMREQAIEGAIEAVKGVSAGKTETSSSLETEPKQAAQG
jgi:hypothetical protein